MNATHSVEEHLGGGESPQSEAGGFPRLVADPEPDIAAAQTPPQEPEPDSASFSSTFTHEDIDRLQEHLASGRVPHRRLHKEVPEPELQEDVSPAQEAPLEIEQVTVSKPAPETHVREIPGAAGHGPARAYGYIAVASALGADASLSAGGTRSTSRNPLLITVRTGNDNLFEHINSLYDVIAPAAEEAAAHARAEARKSGRAFRSSYDIALLTRAVLAGFPQGAVSALREPGTTRPAPLRESTRARLSDNQAFLSAIAAGRAWGLEHLVACSS